MGLGMWAASVVDAGVRHMGGGGAGLGGPAAGVVRARYLIMAGSTSAVYWRKRKPLRTLRDLDGPYWKGWDENIIHHLLLQLD
ncbi:hypothetical protein EYF80_023595 [Liparis tanakae]|uniref:Uncharacterized protein n=1 Tax=Liparis tanakae TaxID=230148 RepID=A0A4Z2HK07_9TELE|nr:hypothetical protein EYF80_023595 [Liparis tanakae]